MCGGVWPTFRFRCPVCLFEIWLLLEACASASRWINVWKCEGWSTEESATSAVEREYIFCFAAVLVLILFKTLFEISMKNFTFFSLNSTIILFIGIHPLVFAFVIVSDLFPYKSVLLLAQMNSKMARNRNRYAQSCLRGAETAQRIPANDDKLQTWKLG